MRIVIYGTNEMASVIAAEFFEDHDIIIVDPSAQNLEKFKGLDVGTVCGDCSNLNVLRELDFKFGDAFIACTQNDEANIVACLMVKQLSNAKTVCFVSRKECRDSLRLIREEAPRGSVMNIDHIIWPERLLTQEIFRIVTVPEAIDVETFAEGRAQMFEYRIKQDSILQSKKIQDCDFPEEVLVVGIVRDEALFIPSGSTEFQSGDKAIFIGTPEGLDICANNFFSENDRVKQITIIGGGSVGYELAKSLEKTKIKTKIIERNLKRCEFLSENLQKTLVLNADGTNIELLSGEDVGDDDVCVSITNNDEKNLLCSLLAKQLGVKKVITRVAQQATAKLFEKVGVDIALSAKETAVAEIRNRIIEPEIDILASVERGLGEIIEIIIPNVWQDVSLMNLKLPAPAVIAIIQRGSKVIIPKGQTLIRAEDKLIIFTMTENSDKIKDYFIK
ncbi:Trk system potassium transporter TrkA [bacterium]|nr:Trk system potassium transporter TrkA [bacterium]